MPDRLPEILDHIIVRPDERLVIRVDKWTTQSAAAELLQRCNAAGLHNTIIVAGEEIKVIGKDETIADA